MNKQYLAILGTIAAAGALGMVKTTITKGSQNPHSGRIRVNFNVNKSTLARGVDNKYYQYSVYGNPYVIENSTYARDINPITASAKGTRTNWAELVCLKDVTVWCDVKRMKAFHKALTEGMKRAEQAGFNFKQKQYYVYIDKFLAGEHPFQEGKKTRRDY